MAGEDMNYNARRGSPARGRNLPVHNRSARSRPRYRGGNNTPWASGESSGSDSPTRPINSRNYTTPELANRGRPASAPVIAPGRDVRNGSHHYRQGRPVPLDEAYKSWRETSVRINNLPSRYVDTWELYKFFSRYGQISYISIDDRGSAGCHGQARIVFSTTPNEAFWTFRNLALPLEGGRQSSPLAFTNPQPGKSDSVQSPIDTRRTFPRILVRQDI